MIAKDGTSLGTNMAGCLHRHKLERCDVDGSFGLKSVALYRCHDQINAVLDLCMEGVAPGGWGRCDVSWNF